MLAKLTGLEKLKEVLDRTREVETGTWVAGQTYRTR